jgi:hypothetical protein
MKETLKTISITFVIIIACVSVITFVVWMLSDPFDIVPEPTPEPVYIYTYTWSQCFDNDNDNFSQEYADKVAMEVEKNNPGGIWVYRGYQGIIGCGGDLFYSYKVK